MVFNDTFNNISFLRLNFATVPIAARQACTEGLSQMTALELCQAYAHIDLSFYIETCINDIKVIDPRKDNQFLLR
jgi:hypothetical protein